MRILCAVLIYIISALSTLANDLTTLRGKHIVGYQGWFGCPSDKVDPRWYHWIQNNRLPASNTLRVDLWPDLSEFDADELCPIDLTPDVRASVFSSVNQKTVRRHFKWMREYEIDGASIQRFVGEIARPEGLQRINLVLKNVRAAAEAEGRGFFILYDVSGLPGDQAIQMLENDWERLMRETDITASPSYMRHRGRPVVALWGLGVGGRTVTPRQAMSLIRFFRERNVTLLGGVGAFWRTSGADVLSDPAWQEVYRSFDVISPWTVGRYRNQAGINEYTKQTLSLDLADTQKRGQDYMPVVFPGFSWHNLSNGKDPLDQIPRRCGAFYAAQVKSFVTAGANMLFTAMFDELDEGTAIFKIVRRREALPRGAAVFAPDQGQCEQGTDIYLRAARNATEMLHSPR
jgi:hypothetical protein